MKAGSLRHRLTVRSKASESVNSYGENTTAYTTDQTVWAAIDDMGGMTGRELLVARQILSEGDHIVRTRYRTGMTTAKQFVTHDSRVFDVESVWNVEDRNRELIFRCKETNPRP